ncbi:MAG: 4Fe-4S dicluster domain-containing protein, partial [Defluviitaleaceae bacterium]|nr:4Fe-4S dicluster domain-containing protein [Defluviitaleaceae bacterium]
ITPAPFWEQPFTIFGVKACDVAAIAVMDNVYLKGDFTDEFYKSRREAATIVSLACGNPGKACFCNAFGIDPAAPGADVDAWLTDTHLYFKPQNEKGEAFVQSLSHLFDKAEENDIEPLKNEIREKSAATPYANLPLDAFTPENMLKIFNHENWEHLFRPCIGCGTCTYICPTCSCYDIRDYESKCGDIKRFRCWDSCMYPDFTLMAHGNPRHSQKERFRQRFMHKLLYHPEKFGGQFGCVGCGRCVNKCPVSLNIVKIAKSLGGGR